LVADVFALRESGCSTWRSTNIILVVKDVGGKSFITNVEPAGAPNQFGGRPDAV